MIPTYRPRRDFLEGALRSVLCQAPAAEEMEIHVVDDGTPGGGPAQWVREIGGGRVRFTQLETNLGLAGAWNESIALANGEWVHILHQDDLVEDGFYRLLEAVIRANPEAGAACSRWCYLAADGSPSSVGPLEMEASGVLRDWPTTLATSVHIICASIVVRRSVYERVGGFDHRLTHALDWEMWMRIASRYPFVYEPSILAGWRLHPEGTTAGQLKSGENVRDIGRAIRAWRCYFPRVQGRRLARKSSRYWSSQGLEIARSQMKYGDYAASRAQTAAALCCSPTPATFVGCVKTAAAGMLHWFRSVARRALRRSHLGGRT